jgi:hypothetical protein
MIFIKIISKYFWVAAILMTCINVFMFKRRPIPDNENSPEASEDYDKLIRGYLFWMNLPWIVMGIGCTIGGVPTVFHYCRPRDSDPFVLAWWGSVLILHALGVYWMFFCKGAEKLAKYRMISYSSFGSVECMSSPSRIKLVFLLCLTGGIIAAITMWTTNIQLPSSLTGQ